jgi:predicted nucleic acid-binding protein
MIRQVFIDTGPLALIVHSNMQRASVKRSVEWLKRLLENGVEIYVPEICDYELRRELIHMGFEKSLEKLDKLKRTVSYAPITTSVMLKAADLWAKARKQGRPSAGDKDLDADMILSAQVLVQGNTKAVVATGNEKHLSLFCDARQWEDVE